MLAGSSRWAQYVGIETDRHLVGMRRPKTMITCARRRLGKMLRFHVRCHGDRFVRDRLSAQASRRNIHDERRGLPYHVTQLARYLEGARLGVRGFGHISDPGFMNPF